MQGLYLIGSEAFDDYPLWSVAIADLVTMTGDLTLRGARAEEINETTDLVVNIDTAGFKLTLDVAPGAKHSGGAYGDGHRINFDNYDSLTFDEVAANSLNGFVVKDISFDCRGANNIGVFLADCCDSTPCVIEGLLIVGDSASHNGVYVNYKCNNAIIRNNIAYDFLNSVTDRGFGFFVDNEFNITGKIEFYNNTSCKNKAGIGCESSTPAVLTLIVKNNFCQGNLTDYAQTTSFDIFAANISMDASSPDTGFTNQDKTAWFADYANNDFRPAGTADALLAQGVDLSTIGVPSEFDFDNQGLARSSWYIGAHELPSAIDTTIPVITLLGSNPVNVTQNTVYTDAGATASDNIDGDLTASIITLNPVDTAVINAYTVTYNVSDVAGNPAVEVTRTVNVTAVAPIFNPIWAQGATRVQANRGRL